MAKLIDYPTFFNITGVLPDMFNKLVASGMIKVSYVSNVMMIDEQSMVSWSASRTHSDFRIEGGIGPFSSHCPLNVASRFERIR